MAIWVNCLAIHFTLQKTQVLYQVLLYVIIVDYVSLKNGGFLEK